MFWFEFGLCDLFACLVCLCITWFVVFVFDLAVCAFRLVDWFGLNSSCLR